MITGGEPAQCQDGALWLADQPAGGEEGERDPAGLADGQAGTESAGDIARVAELADGYGAGAGSRAARCASAASRNSAMMLPAARSGPCSPDRDLSQVGIYHVRVRIAC
jgi:hypothetical protein